MTKGCQVYLWKCTVCGEKSYGKKPPATCEKCSVEANRYILVARVDKDLPVSHVQGNFGMPIVNCPLYIIGSIQGGKTNAMCCSSVTPVTYYPARVAVAINKNNLTYDYIKESGVFSLAPLGQSQAKWADHFGRNSGRQLHKLEEYNHSPGKTGSPIIEGCIGYYECQVEHQTTVDLDSHTLFVAKIVESAMNYDEPFLTYFDYLGHYPKNNINGLD